MTTQLTQKGWSNGSSGNWTKRADKVKDKRKGILQSSRVTSETRAGDDLILGEASSLSGVNINGNLRTQAGNDNIKGQSTSTSGIYNEGTINTGQENDKIRGISSGSRGLENQGSIFTEDGNDKITGKSNSQEGITNSGYLSMGGGSDTLQASGVLAALRNDSYISMGQGSDLVNCLNGGFSGKGRIDLDTGFDTVIGFGDQEINGGGDRDTLLLKEGRYKISNYTDQWGNTYGKQITNEDNVTMIVDSIESIGSALSKKQVDLDNGTLLINAMGEVSYL